jgi:hypothetical protein
MPHSCSPSLVAVFVRLPCLKLCVPPLTISVYVFIGSVAVGPKWFRIIPGALVGLVGIGYVVLEYIPSIEPPANMRDADAGWGAEQV